jgi:hypothetical protein
MVLIVVGAAVAQPPVSGAQIVTVRPDLTAFDRLLADRIYVRLAERARVGADFDVRVSRGVVTLSGTVPDDQTRRRMLRAARGVAGVSTVQDQLRVDPAAGRLRSDSPVGDEQLEQQVAETIAAALGGARAGEDWWFTGWRVEGPHRSWIMTVDAADGEITLDGKVTYAGTRRRAVRAALRVPGVLSVRSSVELEGALYGNPGHWW